MANKKEKNNVQKTPMKEICKKYNLTQAELASKFGIPLRSVGNWCTGERTPPDYVVKMIETILEFQADNQE